MPSESEYKTEYVVVIVGLTVAVSNVYPVKLPPSQRDENPEHVAILTLSIPHKSQLDPEAVVCCHLNCVVGV